MGPVCNQYARELRVNLLAKCGPALSPQERGVLCWQTASVLEPRAAQVGKVGMWCLGVYVLLSLVLHTNWTNTESLRATRRLNAAYPANFRSDAARSLNAAYPRYLRSPEARQLDSSSGVGEGATQSLVGEAAPNEAAPLDAAYACPINFRGGWPRHTEHVFLIYFKTGVRVCQVAILMGPIVRCEWRWR